MLRKKIFAIAGGLLVVLAAVAVLLWSVTKNSAPPFLKGINANGYEEFVRANRLLVGSPDEAESLGEFVKTNQPALEAFRRALQLRFEAPAETYDIHSLSATVLPNLVSLKRLRRAVESAGEKRRGKSGLFERCRNLRGPH